jgi:hypothetical protein
MTDPDGVVRTVGLTDDGTTMPRTNRLVAVPSAPAGMTYQKSGPGLRKLRLIGAACIAVAARSRADAIAVRRFIESLLRTEATGTMRSARED